LILSGTLLSFSTHSLLPLVLSGNFSFLFLLLREKNQWTPTTRFGLGNLLTFSRLLLISVTALFYSEIPNTFIAILGLIILIADGLDGLLARNRNESSMFGEYFDKETDAFFLHIWVMMAVMKSLLWPWTVILGLLRYLFIVYLFILGEREKKERRFKKGRYIFVYVICVLLATFLPMPWLYKPAVIVAFILLLYSFGRDLVWIHSKN
jgi:phosphatidylglycerophosphate synthase